MPDFVGEGRERLDEGEHGDDEGRGFTGTCGRRGGLVWESAVEKEKDERKRRRTEENDRRKEVNGEWKKIVAQ